MHALHLHHLRGGVHYTGRYDLKLGGVAREPAPDLGVISIWVVVEPMTAGKITQGSLRKEKSHGLWMRSGTDTLVKSWQRKTSSLKRM